jgi:hypothetical protein
MVRFVIAYHRQQSPKFAPAGEKRSRRPATNFILCPRDPPLGQGTVFHFGHIISISWRSTKQGAGIHARGSTSLIEECLYRYDKCPPGEATPLPHPDRRRRRRSVSGLRLHTKGKCAFFSSQLAASRATWDHHVRKILIARERPPASFERRAFGHPCVPMIPILPLVGNRTNTRIIAEGYYD